MTLRLPYFQTVKTVYFQSAKLTDLAERDLHIQLWMEDTAFVLDQVEKLNREDVKALFTGRIDTSRIGMFGHSYGGAAAAQMLLKDARIKAAIDMDGTLYGSTVSEMGIGKLFLLIIPHTDHTSFSDFHLISPFLRSSGEDTRRVHRIINEFSPAFFDHYVKALDRLAAIYPEVK